MNINNEEQIVSLLQNALSGDENATQADIDYFKVIKKIYAKNVPFSRRKYVTAYLVKQALQGGRSRFGHDRRLEHSSDRYGAHQDRRMEERRERTSRYDRSSRIERSERPERGERHERAPRVQIDPAVAATIFISVGRNRRVFPRDLVGLLISVAGLERERIGDIRVLANYSFIQLFKDDCEKVIGALNGYDYRGRKLSVSYSKMKAEGEDGNIAADADSEPQVQRHLEGENASYDKIPENVSNESYGVKESNESSKISEEQSAFAVAMQSKVSASGASAAQSPYSETTDDGQVKSHFGSGDAY